VSKKLKNLELVLEWQFLSVFGDKHSQGTLGVKCLLVHFENAPKIPLFNIPKLHFEQGSEAQSFLDTKSASNSTYNAKLVYKMLFLALILNM